MTAYTEYRFYSSELDSEAVRLSIAGEYGAEYFAIVEAGEGKGWRERKALALETLDNAVRMEWPPGMVAIVAGPERVTHLQRAQSRFSTHTP